MCLIVKRYLRKQFTYLIILTYLYTSLNPIFLKPISNVSQDEIFLILKELQAFF